MIRSELPKVLRRPLGLKHAIRVQAAEYWLALGKFDEAENELRRIQLSRRNHPEVQRMRARILREARVSSRGVHFSGRGE